MSETTFTPATLTPLVQAPAMNQGAATAVMDSCEPVLRPPSVGDGAEMWRVARDSIRLDLNPPYAYLLWARDFADTSAVAEFDGELGGFVTGFRRPESPDTLMVWQVAVDEQYRGRGVASRLLDHLVDRTNITTLETTITEDNPESNGLFDGFARRHGAEHTVDELFEVSHFPDSDPWDAELLHRIAPLSAWNAEPPERLSHPNG